MDGELGPIASMGYGYEDPRSVELAQLREFAETERVETNWDLVLLVLELVVIGAIVLLAIASVYG